MLALLAIVAVITWLLWRSFIKIYSKAQAALEETFAQPPAPRPNPAPAALPSMLREADLETITIAADSAVAGKLIRELELRTRTGASIVGIERNGANIINPGPDEELQLGRPGAAAWHASANCDGQSRAGKKPGELRIQSPS